MKKIRIFDIETNALPNVTTIHCLVYYDTWSGEWGIAWNHQEIRMLFEDEDVIWCGHNIVRFDIPVLVKLVGIKKPKFMIDSLAVSFYLYPQRKKHGLEEWGIDVGIAKPKISDWSSLSREDYIHRCTEDVKINKRIWKDFYRFLIEIYGDEESVLAFLDYLSFKMDCVREQEEEGLALDIPFINECLAKWEPEKEKKERELEEVMPQVARKKTKKYENATTDVHGNLFTMGDLFYDATISAGGKKEKEVKLSRIVGWEDPNSASQAQLKDWLFSLGWKPQNMKREVDKKTRAVKMIPQLKDKDPDKDGELCPSIKLLFEKEPKLAVLDGLFVLTHRINVLKKFLKDQVNGIIYPSMGGLANTLRLKHKVIANLPAISTPYGKEIRKCIIAKPGHILIGADLSNIEDRTKRHYIYKYDPKYVEDMNTPGYDAHLELGLKANLLTQEEADYYKWYEKQMSLAKDGKITFSPSEEEKTKYLSAYKKRFKSKTTNFSATYKVGADTLSERSGLSLKESRKVLKAYWERNHAILDVEEECLVKEVDNTRWLQNPISKFWYSLRSDKDKFSTLNQGTAVYMFDMWIKPLRELGQKVPFQYHDEILLNTPIDDREATEARINQAMATLNKNIPLNVPVGCSIKVGNNYAETH